MAGELGYYPTGPNAGKLIYSPNSTPAGKLARTCGGLYYKLTPCIEYGSTCNIAYCSDGTPKYITVVISGVTVDTATCWDWAPQSLKHLIAASINGTYILTQSGGNACLWELVEASSGGQSRRWTGANCEGAIDWTVDEYQHTISLKKGVYGGNYRWRIDAYCDLRDADPPSVTYSYYWFSNLDSGVSDKCLDYATWSDTWAATMDLPTTGATIQIYPGVAVGQRCPGGSAIYTDTDLSAYLGKAVTITADSPPVCYFVSQEGDHSDGGVTVATSFDTCALCCPTP